FQSRRKGSSFPILARVVVRRGPHTRSGDVSRHATRRFVDEPNHITLGSHDGSASASAGYGGTPVQLSLVDLAAFGFDLAAGEYRHRHTDHIGRDLGGNPADDICRPWR